MTISSPPEGALPLQRCAKGAAVLGLLVGLVALLGRTLGLPRLQEFVSGAKPMVANTALALVLLGSALWLLTESSGRRGGRILAWSFAALSGLIGLLSAIEDLSGLDLGIDRLLFHETAAPVGYPGRPSLASAICMLLAAAALLLLEVELRRGFRPAELLAGGELLIALVVLNGYLHGALSLGSISIRHPYPGMGLNSAVSYFALGVGVLCARVGGGGFMARIVSDTIGGRLARRLIPAVLLTSQLLGFALELGRRLGAYTAAAGNALFATLSGAGGTVLVLGAAAWLDRIDEARQRSRAALRDSEARFAGLIESAPDPLLITDDQGRIILANAQVEKVFGYRRDELFGRLVELLVPDEKRPEHRMRRAQYLARPDVRRLGQDLELHARRKDGSTLPVEVSLSPFQTEEGLVITAIIRDVSALRRAAEERERLLAREQKARAEAEAERALLQTVLDSTPVGVYFVEAGTERMRANPALSALYGLASGLPERLEQIAHLRHADGSPMSLEEAPSSRALRGERVLAEAVLFVFPDGHRLPTLVNAAPVRGPSGELRGAVVTVQDVSERLALERMREEYVGLISHDLRNPLNAISLRTRLLQKALEERGLEREARSTEVILLNARRMSAMIDELLETTRLESERVELREKPTDLARLVSEVLEDATPPGERGRFHLEVPEPLRPVPADPERLTRVLVNFLTNALKYSPPGSPVQVRLVRDGEQVVVSVRDHGPGLAPEELPRLFEKYYRTSAAMKHEGLGLGLYICRLIVEAHGGRVWVENAPGGGAIFSFSLPLVAPPEREAPPRAPSPDGGPDSGWVM